MPPRYPLGIFPTPLVEAPRLSRALAGPRILLKRDDLIGFGFGGNKVRGLEYYLADAVGQGADVIVTGAGPQSNHIRATAAAARVAGLEIIAVMHDAPPARAEGNLLLDALLGAEVRFTHHPDRTRVDAAMDAVLEELRRAGRRPYLIPRGGASGLSALAYTECVREMAAQLAALGVRPTWLVLSTGACATQAGLLAGTKIYGLPVPVLGITVSRPLEECLERIGRFAREALALAGSPAAIAADEVRVIPGFIGRGYGIPSPEGVDAIRLVARTEGLFFDPTYTGKGMAGLIAEIRSGRLTRDDTVVFLHTGGEPGLFAHPEVAGDVSPA